MTISLKTNKEKNRYEYIGKDGKILIPFPKENTTIFLHSNGISRKITILNIDNVAEALRDALGCMKSFCSTSKSLSKMYMAFKKKKWPTLDGKPLVPTFDNVDVEAMGLSSRAENALIKNNVNVLKDIPDSVEGIRNLRSVGQKVAKEIHNTRKAFLKKSPKKKTKRKASKKKSLIVDSKLPKNLQKLLTENALVFVSEIPESIDELLKLKKIGPSKAHQIHNILN